MPTVLLFVQGLNGISNNKIEDTKEEHIEMSVAALDAMEKDSGEKKFDILGFCIGGILVTATVALLAARKDKRIATATTFATMVDFTDVGEIGVFIDRDRLKVLRPHMKEKRSHENHHLQDMFSTIREDDLDGRIGFRVTEVNQLETGSGLPSPTCSASSQAPQQSTYKCTSSKKNTGNQDLRTF